ncbi:hypothetical protein CPB83DRAFT_849596 [Crepidotus variabilis]|uniref:Zn(2)-C6 fungal-type domain-containing protein n=1 Tax=Crepidotus variabilis TaxID=179855 RepID=A0A9P6JT59_9AGAR|nr:hypothetical protein CPB83DRAFT_849596 [Crepidotus variabilis]
MSSFASYADSAQQGAVAAQPSMSTEHNQTPSAANSVNDDAGKKKKTTKRRKVNHACLYCRRSHMTCDEGRPCQRCIKREIGHLCHDERRPKVGDKPPVAPATSPGAVDLSRSYAPVQVYQGQPAQQASAWPMAMPGYMYQPESFGNEFSVLTDFLETLDDGTFFSPPATVAPALVSSNSFPTPNTANSTPSAAPTTAMPNPQLQNNDLSNTSATAVAATTNADVTETMNLTTSSSEGAHTDGILPAATKTEKFLLTAADQESGSRDERLNRVIRSKYEAGLLKPYNYVKGYARLSRWMDRNVSQESKQQILQPLSVLRPKFRAVAQSLRDLDLVFIEEAFERMLLDYDRVFSAMGVPACLWRRTGEIYKANREFTELIGLDGYMMRDGRLCIYELMAEESAVNYWEKYGHVAFDSSQKAVLTSCVLRYKPVLNAGATSPLISKASLAGTGITKKEEEDDTQLEDGYINCCFSFTIRRDKWGIPSMIVGNFIKC